MNAPAADTAVLCVDLDGSLVHTDLLHEAALLLARQAPVQLGALPLWLARGKAHLKAQVAARVVPAAEHLPYHAELLEWLRAERAAGRRLVLCTGSDRAYADRVAAHLGLFDQVIATEDGRNNSGGHKAATLVARYGERGFDYVGNSRVDLAVWAHARRAIVVGGAGLGAAAARLAPLERRFDAPAAGLDAWLRALRLHQWLKNLLLVLPLLGAHRLLDAAALRAVGSAFVSFGLCASAVYILNDLFDLEADRRHPRKRARPFAAGTISIPRGLLAAAACLGVGGAVALQLPPDFLAWLLGYLALTTAYTLVLKSRALVDCLALAGLYTLRVAAGGAAAEQPISFWLMAFCLFLFLSLAYVKRYAELVDLGVGFAGMLPGRGYAPGDAPLLRSFGVTAGFASALVFALYLNSDAVLRLYTHPERLWFTLPVLVYWISRMWLRAARGQMHDDPVLFAIRDPASLGAGALFLASLWFAR